VVTDAPADGWVRFGLDTTAACDGGGIYDDDFDTQHAAYWDPDGNLALFDNRDDVAGNSRGVIYEIDEMLMTAESIEQYTVENVTGHHRPAHLVTRQRRRWLGRVLCCRLQTTDRDHSTGRRLRRRRPRRLPRGARHLRRPR